MSEHIGLPRRHDNKNVFEQVHLDLGPGTVLLLDNWRVTHSRTAYAGHRLLLIQLQSPFLFAVSMWTAVCLSVFLISYCAS